MNKLRGSPGAAPSARAALRASRLAGCSGGSTQRLEHAHGRRRRADRLREARQHDRHEPDQRRAQRAGRRPDDPREVVAERDRAQHHRAVHAGQGRRVRPRGLVRRQEDRLLDALPGDRTPSTIDGAAGLHRPLEHLGIRHDGRRPRPAARFRRITSSTDADDVDPAYLPAGRGFVFTSNRQTKSKRQPGARPHLLRARRIRARARVQPAHDGCRGRQHHADLVQPEPRPQPGRCARTATSCSRAGTTSAAATTSRSSAPSPTAPTCSCCTARTARATASCTRATWTRRASTRASLASDLMPLSRTHEGGALVFIDAANYSEQNTPANSRRAGDRRPGRRSTAAGAEHRRRPVAVRPHHHAVSAVGRHRPRAAGLPPVRGHARRRRRRRARR